MLAMRAFEYCFGHFEESADLANRCGPLCMRSCTRMPQRMRDHVGTESGIGSPLELFDWLAVPLDGRSGRPAEALPSSHVGEQSGRDATRRLSLFRLDGTARSPTEQASIVDTL